jgi:hypothetical protein
MTSAHLIYIPMMLAIGAVIGFVLGGRAARDALAMDKMKQERRAAAKAAREAATKTARENPGKPTD